MSIDGQLLALTQLYLASKVSFDELALWVQDQEPYWSRLPDENDARSLAGTIMLAAYEVWDGDRDEASARELIAEAAKERAS